MTEKHEQLLQEVVLFAESLGCKPGAPCAYHDILPSAEKDRMANDYSPAGLAARLRADRRIWHPTGSCFKVVDAKTSTWDRQFPVEALQIGFHVVDNDGCLLAMQSYGKRNMDRGLILTRENVSVFIKEIRIPDGFRRAGKTCNRRRMDGVAGYPNIIDDADFYQSEFLRMFPGVPVHVVSHSVGSGDPFAVFDTDVFESLPDWRDVVSDWALER
jgi:hypothetical protein